MKNNEKLREINRKCIEPAVGKKVYDYYNNALGVAEVNRFERHLIDCPYCEKVILELDLSLAVLSDEQDFEFVAFDKNSPEYKAAKEIAAPEAKQRKHK